MPLFLTNTLANDPQYRKSEKSLEPGYTRFQLSAIICRVWAVNAASIRVPEKRRLRFFDRFEFDGEAGRINRTEFDGLQIRCPLH